MIGDILHQSRLSKKELYAAITELQIGGVETVSFKVFFLSNLYQKKRLPLLAIKGIPQKINICRLIINILTKPANRLRQMTLLLKLGFHLKI